MPAPVDSIQTELQPRCAVCGSAGRTKYEGLRDGLFGAPGSWNLKECIEPGCGTLWLDPRPTLAEIGKAYASYYTHDEGRGVVKRIVRALARERGAARYGFCAGRLPGPGKYVASTLAGLYPGLGEHLDLLVRYLRADAMGGGKLLDVGCGDGQALEVLADLGWSAVGLEIDERAVRVARARGLDVRSGALQDAAFAESTFDAVTSAHVIEHVHDCRAFLSECRRVLKPGGCLVAVTPNARAPSHRLHGRHWRGLEPPRHLVLFTREGLRSLAESVGLKSVHVRSSARAVAYVHIASTKMRQDGRYEEGRWPGLPTWLAGQLLQCKAQLALNLGRHEGDELVLRAVK